MFLRMVCAFLWFKGVAHVPLFSLKVVLAKMVRRGRARANKLVMSLFFDTVESSKSKEEDYQEEGPKGHLKHFCHV